MGGGAARICVHVAWLRRRARACCATRGSLRAVACTARGSLRSGRCSYMRTRGSLRSGRGGRRGRLAPCRGPLEGARAGGSAVVIGHVQVPPSAWPLILPALRAPGPHGRSLGERPRRSATPPPAPDLGCRDWEGSGRELRCCTVPLMATSTAAPLSCPLRGHPQASPGPRRQGLRCMGPRRRGRRRGASRAGGVHRTEILSDLTDLLWGGTLK
jgi:hypothetical protein